MGEEFTTKDLEPVDFVIEHVMDDINEIRNEITEEAEVSNKETLDYLDKILELFCEFFDDYKSTVKKVKDNSVLVRNLSLLENAVGVIEEEEEIPGDSIKVGDMYS